MTHAAQGSTRRAHPTIPGLLLLPWLCWALVACESDAASDADGRDALVVLLPREPQQLDPRHVGDAYGLKLSRLIHGSLFTIDPRTLDVVPQLAADYHIEGGVQYDIELRPDAYFADGSRVTAADVAATFRALVDPAVESRYARTYARIQRVQALSERQVRFVLDAPHATFLTDLEMPVLRADQAATPPGGPPGGLLGAGPYRLVSRELGRWRFAENPHYALAPVERAPLLMLLVRDDNTRALRLQAGEADLALNAVPSLLIPAFTHDPRFRVRTAPGVGTTYIGVNLEAPELADVRVRWALAHAIDRPTLVATKLDGRATLASSFIPPGHWAQADDVPRHAHDPARARALLDAAGFTPDADGVRLRLTLRCGADRGVQSMARAIAAMFARVGVSLDVRPSETATLLADLARGRFQLAYMQIPEVFEPHVLSWFFAGNRIPIAGQQEGSNRWRLRDPVVDRALERGRANVEPAARKAAYRVVQRRLAEQLPVIPLWHEDVVAVTSRRLPSFQVPRDGRFSTLAR